MNDKVQPYELLTEDGIKHALIEARGDIFVAAQLLKIPALRLNRALRASPLLSETLLAIQEQGPGVSDKSIDDAIRSRLSIYRVVGLDALHDLATMPIDVNSAQNQVKLAAAARLAGETGGVGSSDGLADVFRELRETYQTEAPRLRVIRERTTTTIELSPDQRVVSEQPAGSAPDESP